MKNKLFIVFEGIDGCGKTTISKIVSSKMNGILYKTPCVPFENIRSDIDEKCDPISRFFFYLSSVYYVSCDLRSKILDHHIICDRYIYSTLAYHYTLDDRIRKFDKSLIEIRKPDIVFYLKATFSERTKRISSRPEGINTSLQIEKKMTQEFQENLEKEFLKFSEMIVIDTTTKSVNDVSNECIEIIDRYINDK